MSINPDAVMTVVTTPFSLLNSYNHSFQFIFINFLLGSVYHSLNITATIGEKG